MKLLLTFFCLVQGLTLFSQQTKSDALMSIRLEYAKKPYRDVTLDRDSIAKLWSRLNKNGEFEDYQDQIKEITEGGYATKGDKQRAISKTTKPVFDRLWMMSEMYRNSQVSEKDSHIQKLFKAILFYGAIENERLNTSARWHESCFAIPVASTHIFYALYDLVQQAESGKCDDALVLKGIEMLGRLSMQCWTTPARNDETDENVVDVERFRKHAWWVGGNATGYRPLLQTAAQLLDNDMADVIKQVAVQSISCVSQVTYDTAFWEEGITADGAGWGHGTQCLVWGYPIHGTVGSLQILDLMRDYPSLENLSSAQVSLLLDFIRGSSYYYYRGYVPPVVDRGNMNRLENRYAGRKGNEATYYRYPIPSLELANILLEKFESYMAKAEREELKAFVNASETFQQKMPKTWCDMYENTRYFFNNDDIIKKTDDYYIFVNMASNRVSGLESAYTMAAAFNVFTCDGSTLFFRRGVEHQEVLGAYNLNCWPGTTSRFTSIPLNPIENWNGYNSMYNYSAGATSGSSSFAGGFIFEKNNRLWQRNNSNYDAQKDKNPQVFGVKAYKGYFMFDDILLAMGCGIENKQQDIDGNIVTTIEQARLHPDFQNDKRAVNNGIYYTLIDSLTHGVLVCDTSSRETKWQTMSIENKQPETTEQIFHLYIDHGKSVSDATYAYTVAFTPEADRRKPYVLSNTKQVQAAESCDGVVIGAVFYETSSFVQSSKGKIQVSKPCALLYEEKEDSVFLTLTDGLMNPLNKEIVVETTIPLEGKTVSCRNDKYYITALLPTKEQTGAPVTVRLKKRNHEK